MAKYYFQGDISSHNDKYLCRIYLYINMNLYFEVYKDISHVVYYIIYTEAFLSIYSENIILKNLLFCWVGKNLRFLSQSTTSRGWFCSHLNNTNETKIISPTKMQLTLANNNIENVTNYVYHNQKSDITRQLNRAALCKLRHILQNIQKPINLKSKVYDVDILQLATCDLETVVTTNHNEKRWRTPQRAKRNKLYLESL